MSLNRFDLLKMVTSVLIGMLNYYTAYLFKAIRFPFEETWGFSLIIPLFLLMTLSLVCDFIVTGLTKSLSNEDSSALIAIYWLVFGFVLSAMFGLVEFSAIGWFKSLVFWTIRMLASFYFIPFDRILDDKSAKEAN